MTVEVSTIVLMRGLPGSGKSYIAAELFNELGGEKMVILDPDTVDSTSSDYKAFCEELEKQEVEPKLFPYRYLRSQAYTAIEQGKLLVWNQAFTNQELVHRTILNLQTYAIDHGYLKPKALVVDVLVPVEVAKSRVARRSSEGGHTVSEQEFERFINDFSSFSGYDYSVLTLDGTQQVRDEVDELKAKLTNL